MAAYLSLLKKLPVAANLGIGFAIVLALTLAVAGAGLHGMADADQGTKSAGEIQQMVELMNEARLAEKDFMFHEDDPSAAKATRDVAAFLEKAAAARASDPARMDTLIVLAHDHERAFASYLAAQKAGKLAEQGMIEAARTVEKVAEDVRTQDVADYRTELSATTDRAALAGRLEAVVDWGRVLQQMLQARRHEKNFQLRGERTYVDQVEESVARAESIVKALSARDPKPEHRKAAAGVLSGLLEYRQSFQKFVADQGERKGLELSLGEIGASLDAEIDRAVIGRSRESRALGATSRRLLVLGTIAALLLGLVAAAFTNRLIVPGLARAAAIANRVAQGDLTAHIEIDRADEIGRVLVALRTMNERLAVVVGDVHGASDAIARDAGSIAAGSGDLADRTKTQAARLEETAASLEELTAAVKQNLTSALTAGQLAGAARDEAKNGTEVLSRTIRAMDGIREASEKITDIIGVIDEIAFQTNVLALNAAVEAARAGDEGRGFAVVAGEVRKLAHRSSAAAKEIASLIRDNVERVEEGSGLVDASGKSLHDIVAAVDKLGDTVDAISAASREQSEGIDQVSAAMGDIDHVTQQNAALVDDTAGAARSLDEESRALKGLIEYFKIGSPAARAEGAKGGSSSERGAAGVTLGFGRLAGAGA